MCDAGEIFVFILTSFRDNYTVISSTINSLPDFVDLLFDVREQFVECKFPFVFNSKLAHFRVQTASIGSFFQMVRSHHRDLQVF